MCAYDVYVCVMDIYLCVCVWSRWFFTTVWCGIVALSSLLFLSVSLFVVFFAERDFISFNCNVLRNFTACPTDIRLLGGVVPDPVFPVVCALIALACLVCVGFLGHLGCFHIYLSEWSDQTLRRCACVRECVCSFHFSVVPSCVELLVSQFC